MKTFRPLLTILLLIWVAWFIPISCAQRGRPDGGPKDTIPPSFVDADPPNFSTNFDKEEIRMNFDEYIKLEEPDQQVLISPPMKTIPIIKPQGQALEYVEIEFTDTLKENTTYTINFGKSIVDNNEGNELPYFKYVFSTGDYVDSLKVAGKVTDAFDRETEEGISVMLYRLDSTYSDSIIYQESPTYVAYTRDTTNEFSLENLHEGDYKMVALQDENRDYKFQPKSEKIGFLEDTIRLPEDQDKTFDLEIFKAILDYKPEKKPERASKKHLIFGYQGEVDSVSINLLSEAPEDYRARYYREQEHDSIDYWFEPALEEADTLYFEMKNKDQRDTLRTVFKDEDLDVDSLEVSADPSSNLPLDGTVELSANTPMMEVDTSLISIVDKDSVNVPFESHLDSLYNTVTLDFPKKEEEKYLIQAFPGAITDFYDDQNDTLQYNLSTKAEREYADVNITLNNLNQYPVIVQLVKENGESVKEIEHHEADGDTFNFEFVPPDDYYVRIIYDENDNGIYDTGDYLEERQPEKVIYMDKPLDVRKNWEIHQDYTLKP